jgi:hypothetical protein
MLSAMNMIFSQRMNEMSFCVPMQQLDVAAAGWNKFFRLANAKLLGGGDKHTQALLVAHSGFVRNALSSQRLLLSFNNATGAFYRPGTLSTLIDNFIVDPECSPRSDLSTFLKGLRARTKHLMTSNCQPEKIYTISCVPCPNRAGTNANQRPTPRRVCFDLDGTNMSVGAYFEQLPALRLPGFCSC